MSTVTLTGTYDDPFGGIAAGTVSFQLEQTESNGSDTFYVGKPFTTVLDAAGKISQDIVPTEGMSPTASYRVTERIRDCKQNVYWIQVAATPATHDLAGIVKYSAPVGTATSVELIVDLVPIAQAAASAAQASQTAAASSASSASASASAAAASAASAAAPTDAMVASLVPDTGSATGAALASRFDRAYSTRYRQAGPSVVTLPGFSDNLTAPTYDGSNELVHPSVVYFDQPWNGHRWWMAMTPYPSNNSAYENPSLLASDDGITWSVPLGVTNPVVSALSGSDYNSDPYLYAHNDGHLYLFWRSYLPSSPGSEERIRYSRSLDGVTWTPYSDIIVNDASVRRLVAPSVNYDGAQWVIHAVDIVPSPNTVVRATHTTLTGSWTTPMVVSGMFPDAGRDPWHLDVHLYAGGWQACWCDSTIDGSDGGSLYWSTSSDGAVWTTTKVVDKGVSTYYKPAIVAVPDGSGARAWRVYCTSGRKLQTCLVTATTASEKHSAAIVQAVNAITPYVVGDSFNRTDATNLGSAPTGQAWSASAGVPGISAGKAYATTTTNTIATINSGLADGYVAVRFATAPIIGASQGYLVFRFTDSSNYWRLGIMGGGLQLQKIVAGSAITLVAFPSSRAVVDGTIVGVLLKGAVITPVLDGTAWSSVTDNFSVSATSHGWQATTTDPRFDDFLVRGLVNGS